MHFACILSIDKSFNICPATYNRRYVSESIVITKLRPEIYNVSARVLFALNPHTHSDANTCPESAAAAALGPSSFFTSLPPAASSTWMCCVTRQIVTRREKAIVRFLTSMRVHVQSKVMIEGTISMKVRL
uniref:Uncharacterized protein n=1 Tax=Trichogramma kaykai TaxID=54128 RepID=A0ABD2XDN7_9HYME